jgi:hypothetical protein
VRVSWGTRHLASSSLRRRDAAGRSWSFAEGQSVQRVDLCREFAGATNQDTNVPTYLSKNAKSRNCLFRQAFAHARVSASQGVGLGGGPDVSAADLAAGALPVCCGRSQFAHSPRNQGPKSRGKTRASSRRLTDMGSARQSWSAQTKPRARVPDPVVDTALHPGGLSLSILPHPNTRGAPSWGARNPFAANFSRLLAFSASGPSSRRVMFGYSPRPDHATWCAPRGTKR